jgi:hypothetical protein
MKMDPVNGTSDTTALQTELHKVIETFGTEFEEMMMSQMQNVFNSTNAAMKEDENG